MNTVYFDEPCTDDVRRERLFAGQLFVYAPRPSTLAFCGHARGLIEEAFAPHDPRVAQGALSVEQYAEVLGRLKPHFIHHPESKRHIQAVLTDLGCDLERTYFEVPKLRSSTSDGYLTTGIAYAWHPHRDTWYSAPGCQLNYWIPIYELTSDNVMAFHPHYWAHRVANSSRGYNYYEWNSKHRGGHVTQYLKEDPRPLPRATEPMQLDPQVRIVCPVGGVIVFSGAQMHSSVPNTSGVTRFSIDFRTVHIDDLVADRGAPNVDAECTGTTIRDYQRGTDLSRLPEDVVQRYDDGTAGRGVTLYQPDRT
jgi:hypothetical protein